ncbi:Uncharacterised protein [Legionella beliardensis]|uniref:Uncharacterized protein n=1 Tax=Legionella beliardensis TaxID=91822 RepID=A0A378I0X2_9GAMM|nr:hypothetical protein [Legionella beliardensis]STX28857.1 Uncharacterised protein [Legionella beliardensis]
MYRLSSQADITIYENPARDLTAVQGNSSVVYPFYKSSGNNSKSDQTWFPWMGYFDKHPKNPNELYMVKPDVKSLSAETKAIIRQHLGTNEVSENLISRMGNDEALAISCSLGGGVWATYPKLREDIMMASATKDYIKMLHVEAVKEMQVPPAQKGLTPFIGKRYEGEAFDSHVGMATAMEGVVARQAAKFVSTYSVQDKGKFPKTQELESIAQLSHGKSIRDNYIAKLDKLGLFQKIPPTMPPKTGDDLKGGMQLK